MTNDVLIRFGALAVRYVGDFPHWKPESKLRQFLSSGMEPDLTVRVSCVEQVAEPEGSCIWQTNYQEVYRQNGATTHFYRAAWMDAPYHARLLRRDDTPELLELQVLRDEYIDFDRVALASVEMERVFHEREQTLLHASWVLREGEALLFSGPCGIGKTTQAELWHEFRGTRIINGDKAALSFAEGDVIAYGTVYAGSSSYCEDASASVRAIVMLAQAPTDTIRRLSVKEAVRLLASQMPCQQWCAEDVGAVFDYAERLARAVPVYLLSCTKEKSAVDLLDQTLKKEENHGT